MKFVNGVNADFVAQLSATKQEPEWMREIRLRALASFEQKPMPTWGADLSQLDQENICYYFKAAELQQSWDAVPTRIKKTFEALGVPQAERSFLAGVGAQFESEIIYQSLQEKWQN